MAKAAPVAEKLQIDVRDEPVGRVVAASGDVDLDTSPRLAEAIRGALRSAKSVVVDLSGVGYMDSSGVATLVQGFKLAGRHGVDFRLRDPAPRVIAVLELAELHRLFTIERTGSD